MRIPSFVRRGRACVAASAFLCVSAALGAAPAAAALAPALAAGAEATQPAAPAAQDPAVGTRERPLEAVLELPVAEGSDPVMDWGRVGLEQTVYGRVVVRNTTDEPIRILAMRASCQCTALDDLSGTTLAPGESADAMVSVETRTIAGTIRNQIRFVFSDQTTSTVQLVFETSRAVEADPTYIDALSLPYGVVKLRSVDGAPFRILSAHGRPPVYATPFDPQRDEPRAEYMLVWNLDRYDPTTCVDADGQPMPLWWVVETDHPGAPLVDLRVRHNPCTRLDGPSRDGRRWFLSQNHAVLGRLAAGASADIELEMKWIRGAVVSDTIDRVTDESDDLDVELVSVTRDGDQTRVVIRVTASKDARGFVYDRITVHGQAPGHSQFMPVVFHAFDPAEVAADSRR